LKLKLGKSIDTSHTICSYYKFYEIDSIVDVHNAKFSFTKLS